jgi:hypothetical protein
MLRVYVISSTKQFSQSIKAKLQKRDRKGRFAKPLPKPRDVEQNPLATFLYPMSDQPWNSRKRLVRVISANPKHITGLEHFEGKWQYKKFLQAKATNFQVVSFNPSSMA